MAPVRSHHEACIVSTEPGVDTLLAITVGRDQSTGRLATVVRFPNGQRLVATKGDLDLGFSEPDTVLHDVAHTLLAARLGIGRSPVLERVVDLRPLSQRDVDLEEAATFALQAWCAALRDEDPGPALANLATTLARLVPREAD